MILIDGDNCSKLIETEEIAKQHDIQCHIFCNTHVNIESEYSEVHIVSDEKDAADFAIIKRCSRDDIVITNDTGLAAMVLAKQGIPISCKGVEFTKYNINSYLSSRHIRKHEQDRVHRDRIRGLKQNHHNYRDFRYVLKKVIKRLYEGGDI